MASVNEVLEYAKLLQKDAVYIDGERCASVRNRNSKCQKCADACFVDAISVGSNEVAVDSSVCVNCGVCASVCPTNALAMAAPSLAQIAKSCSKAADFEQSRCMVACARISSKHDVDDAAYAEVPCLGHINEYLICEMAAAGIDDIILIDGDCATCKFGAASTYIDETVDVCAQIFDASGSLAVLTRQTGFPQDVEHMKSGIYSYRGEDRRGLMSKTGAYVKDVAFDVAGKAVSDKLGSTQKKPDGTSAARLSVGKTGHLPHFEPSGNYTLLESMEQMADRAGVAIVVDEERNTLEGEGVAENTLHLNCRRFGRVLIDVEACSGCGLCVMFCPTGALAHNKYDKPADDTHKYLDFSANMCVQCGLCEDICMRNCMKVLPTASVAALFDFEPELLEIKNAETSKKLFQRNIL
jgi:ferredoxin